MSVLLMQLVSPVESLSLVQFIEDLNNYLELFGMKNQERQFELKISTLEFLIKPLQLSIRGGQTHCFSLEFGKGAQILYTFKEEVSLKEKDKVYVFTAGEQGRFKLQSERNCGCEWSVYRKSQNDMSEFVDSLPVSLQDHYSAYVNNLKTMQVDYSHILSEHAQGRQVAKLWDALKPRIQNQFPNLTAMNQKGTFELAFRLEIRSQVDVWVQAERKKVIKTAKSTRSVLSNPEKQLNGSFQKEIHEQDELLPKNSIIVQPIAHSQQKIQVKQQLVEIPKINQPPPSQPETFKKGSVLSDIIQCSVQCSSNMNEKEKRAQLKEISGIPEQQNELYSPYLSSLSNTKTQNFEAMGERHDDVFKKRSNTYDSNYNEFPEDLEKHINDGRRISMPERANPDEELGKQQLQENLETLPQSHVTVKEVELPIKKQGMSKWMVFSLLILTILLFIYTKQIFNKVPGIQPPKKGGKEKRDKQDKQERLKKGKKAK